ncbi:30S ribosomal protein S4e [Methanobrevibacter curvatus]|uniref:Small ribosomal subunit protein eS4 n=1 Tax=Methanobrevibacter curvatus TaxID=49547 RepID=A0A165ZV80_9EURY|nr:30S ribosomal protein S4e [Methanobrevibacter curvatus]KZX11209.1 30S ribosomal protein S4e [Methanobrevibacter curvatus]
MANMGSRKHLKRFKAPKNWSIHPKENKWTVKPSAGPHAIEDSLSLLIVVRDILSLADTAREAKRIINTGKILIDGRISKDYKFPVGFMDIIEIPDTNETYRVLPDAKGRLTLHVIPKENAEFKLCKVSNKTTIEEGKNQLNLHDGRNLLTEEDISVGDVINLKVPEQEITESFSFEEGATVLVTAGKHTGEIGKINEIVVNKSSNPNTIVVENSKKDTFVTLRDYAFVIGKDKAIISLPGGK